eukprot:m.142713 g.142713  ORF g.142713 m.142713 type:complete len:683 (+) comp30264_c0_seq5:113-2161(+)
MPIITRKTLSTDLWGFAYNGPHISHSNQDELCPPCEKELKENFPSIYVEGFEQTDHFCLALLKTVDCLLDKNKIKQPAKLEKALELTLRLLDHLQTALQKLLENVPASTSDDCQDHLKRVRAILKTQFLAAKVNGAQAQPDIRESIVACALKKWAPLDDWASFKAVANSVGKLQAPDFVVGFNQEGETYWYRPRPPKTPRTKKHEVLVGAVTRLHCSLVENLSLSLATLSSICNPVVTTQQREQSKMSVGNPSHPNTPSSSASVLASSSRKRSSDLPDISGTSNAPLHPKIIRQLRRKIHAANISSNIDVIHETIAVAYDDVTRLLNRIDTSDTATHINTNNNDNVDSTNNTNNTDTNTTDEDNNSNNTASSTNNGTNNNIDTTNNNVPSKSVIAEVENPYMMQVYREDSVVPRFKAQIQECWADERKGKDRSNEEIVLFETKQMKTTYGFDKINWKQIFTVFKVLEQRHQPLLIDGLELRKVAESDSSRHGRYGVFVKENFSFPAKHVLGPYCCEVVFDAEYCKTQELSGALDRELGVYEFEWTDNWNLSDNDNLFLKSLIGSGDNNRNILRYVNDYRAREMEANDENDDDYDEEDDDAAVNACFVEVCEKGWPYAFLVTTKDVYGGQEILVNRGKEYWANIRPVQKRQCLRDVNCEKIREVKQDIESLLAVLEHDVGSNQ